MRTPASLLAPLSALLLASACTSGNSPAPPVLGVGGWAWDPSIAGGFPLPVLWWNGTTPTALPLPAGGDCPASGSVQAVAADLSGRPVAAGIAVACAGTTPVMTPVSWYAGQVTALALPAGATQGTALAVVAQPGTNRSAIPDQLVGGATGTVFPVPTVWKNGAVVASDPALLLPGGYDAGMVTSLVASDKFLVAGGVVHRAGSSPPAFAGVVWVFDLDFTASAGNFLPAPSGAPGGGFAGQVTVALVGTTVWSAGGVSSGSAPAKPVIWLDDVPNPEFGSDWTVGPWGAPTAFALLGEVPYATGWVRTASPTAAPQPGIWVGDVLNVLPGAGAAIPRGAGEGVALYKEHAYVAGESLAPDPADRARVVSAPSLWTDGVRGDLQPLSPPGAGPAIVGPLLGWWRLPGTPDADPPDWPWPGASGEVLLGQPVSAAGSGVARAVVAIPPG